MMKNISKLIKKTLLVYRSGRFFKKILQFITFRFTIKKRDVKKVQTYTNVRVGNGKSNQNRKF